MGDAMGKGEAQSDGDQANSDVRNKPSSLSPLRLSTSRLCVTLDSTPKCLGNGEARKLCRSLEWQEVWIEKIRVLADLVDRERSTVCAGLVHDQTNRSDRRLGGRMNQEPVNRMTIKLVPLKAVLIARGILIGIFNAVDLVANSMDLI